MQVWVGDHLKIDLLTHDLGIEEKINHVLALSADVQSFLSLQGIFVSRPQKPHNSTYFKLTHFQDLLFIHYSICN